MSKFEQALDDALMAGIQTGVGQLMHPDATAIVCIAFKTTLGAELFRKEYLKVRHRLNGLETAND